MAHLNRCSGSSNSFHDLSSRTYVSNIEDDVNLNVFNMITRINKSKIISKHVSCNCKSKYDGRKIDVNQK